MSKHIIFEGDDNFYLTISEVIQTYHTTEQIVNEMIAEGIIEIDKTQEPMLFGPQECRYIKIVTRLNHDLGVNTPGAAIILELLKQIL